MSDPSLTHTASLADSQMLNYKIVKGLRAGDARAETRCTGQSYDILVYRNGLLSWNHPNDQELCPPIYHGGRQTGIDVRQKYRPTQSSSCERIERQHGYLHMSHVIATSNRINSAVEHYTGPYVLRNLLTNVALSEDGEIGDLVINCVEFWNANLYVGTSAGEVLHYVLIPAGDGPDEQIQFILATRLQLSTVGSSGAALGQLGVQQVLILPSTDKACIICNGSLTFYSLPELSPLFTTTKLSNCLWVGGLDQDEEEAGETQDEVVIMVCQKNRIRLVKIGDRLRGVREIEIKSCSNIVRRGNIACIADSTSYSLLDVVEKQRIPLFDIASTVEDPVEDAPGGSSTGEIPAAVSNDTDHQPELGSSSGENPESSSTFETSGGDGASSVENNHIAANQSAAEYPPRRSSLQPQLAVPPIPDRPLGGTSAHSSSSNITTEMNRSKLEGLPKKSNRPIPPHIVSPTPNEFLLTTGTSMDDPGVGMFVNLDGDVVRGTLEFSRYPEAVCIDSGHDGTQSAARTNSNPSEHYVLAVVHREINGSHIKALEIQQLTSQPSESSLKRQWLNIEQTGENTEADADQVMTTAVGMRSSVSACQVHNPEITRVLVLKRLTLKNQTESQDNISAKDKAREENEAEFVNRLSSVDARIILWSRDRIWWAVRNPNVVRLDARLSYANGSGVESRSDHMNRRAIEQTVNEVRSQEPQTELDFLGFKYIQQRASLLLYIDVISKNLRRVMTDERDISITEKELSHGEVDPRLVLAILPDLCNEVIEGSSGIWVQNGLKKLIEGFLQDHGVARKTELQSLLSDDIIQLVKRYLQSWRRKKGFGSIADEKEVFETVDAALLHVLLMLDRNSPKGPVPKGSKSLRAELYAVVDHGVDCFERAIELLESFRRLYVLSRLYQSRKMSSHVLGTWRRIIEGEGDAGGELVDGEQEVSRYLSRISDVGLVEEYGAWLAARNPMLGIRVFTDNGNKVNISPSRAVEVLKAGAPNTVKEFLEHLVFDKNLAAYANDLITYYLDSVLSQLESSESARAILLATYESYRALQPPKPPYSQFAMDNAIDANWYRNRLRLLQLLGGSHGAASQYDVSGILARIEPFGEELIPEMIVISGRQGKHKEAIRLLTHGLGDFDTAVSYCVLGGSSTYSPISGVMDKDSIPTREEQMSLFQYVLEEFLRIEDPEARMMQTSELLERFPAWFDVSHVLTLIPESWSLELLSNFLGSSLRSLVTERNETVITKALTSVENLVTSANLIEKIDSFGPKVDYAPSPQNAT